MANINCCIVFLATLLFTHLLLCILEYHGAPGPFSPDNYLATLEFLVPPAQTPTYLPTYLPTMELLVLVPLSQTNTYQPRISWFLSPETYLLTTSTRKPRSSLKPLAYLLPLHLYYMAPYHTNGAPYLYHYHGNDICILLALKIVKSLAVILPEKTC